jgi:two-component system sensor histidine kinase UhpB
LSKNNSILIAEDESIIALDVKSMLERAGYTDVSLVKDVDTLLKKVREKLPSLIIMDIYLNGKAIGIETANKIWEKYNIPVVFISGMDTRDLEKNVDATKSEFVKKPFKETELLKVIKKFL